MRYDINKLSSDYQIYGCPSGPCSPDQTENNKKRYNPVFRLVFPQQHWERKARSKGLLSHWEPKEFKPNIGSLFSRSFKPHCQRKPQMQLLLTTERRISTGWWLYIYHTQHTVNPVATRNKHSPLPPETHPLFKQGTVTVCLPDSPSPLGEMKQEGVTPLSTPPWDYYSLHKFESVHFMQTWTNPPKTNRPHCEQSYTKLHCIFNNTAKSNF